jgi:hypothetical protein
MSLALLTFIDISKHSSVVVSIWNLLTYSLNIMFFLVLGSSKTLQVSQITASYSRDVVNNWKLYGGVVVVYLQVLWRILLEGTDKNYEIFISNCSVPCAFNLIFRYYVQFHNVTLANMHKKANVALFVHSVPLGTVSLLLLPVYLTKCSQTAEDITIPFNIIINVQRERLVDCKNKIKTCLKRVTPASSWTETGEKKETPNYTDRATAACWQS